MKYPETKTVDAKGTRLFQEKPTKTLTAGSKTSRTKTPSLVQGQAGLTDGLWRKSARDELVNEWMALDKLKPASYSAISYETAASFTKNSAAKTSANLSREGWNGTESCFRSRHLQSGTVITIESVVPRGMGNISYRPLIQRRRIFEIVF
jgi:hypothetical protein